MKYRAKITAIHFWVENHYNTCAHHIVSDDTDKYIEVDSIEEAEDLENLNKLRSEERKLKMKIINTYERH